MLALTLYIYWPGLSGPFLFDDFANLDALGAYGGVVDWESLKLFVLGNNSGPTGRPISMLSFLLNDFTWPSTAHSFKYTNLMLHLLNGLLLYTLIYKVLLGMDTNETRALGIALLASGVWLLHPLNVSTVLYPVQRMTILATLFVLLGLTGYVTARRMIPTRPRAAYLLMSISIGLGSLLAVLSKENGALLPLLAWVLEFSVLSKTSQNSPNKHWQAVFFLLPVSLLASYFTYLLISGDIAAGYTMRDFTLAERLLTQPRILLDYLYYWLLPQSGSPGLLSQNFPISRKILSPATTILSITGLGLLIALAFSIRRRAPLFTAAVLFYFAGHLIESTILPLELYFEHRNYMPGVLLALPLAGVIFCTTAKPWYRLLLSIAILAIPTFATASRVSYWENTEALAYRWANLHPDSQRAQRYAALVAESHNDAPLALRIISAAKSRHPDNISILLHWMTLTCQHRALTNEEKIEALGIFRTGKFSFRNTRLLLSSLGFLSSHNCKGSNSTYALKVINAMSKNPNATKAGARHQIHHARGLILLENNSPLEAFAEFSLSMKAINKLSAGMQQVALLASAQQPSLALQHLNNIEKSLPKTKPIGELDYAHEIRMLRALLESEITSRH